MIGYDTVSMERSRDVDRGAGDGGVDRSDQRGSPNPVTSTPGSDADELARQVAAWLYEVGVPFDLKFDYPPPDPVSHWLASLHFADWVAEGASWGDFKAAFEWESGWTVK